MIIAEETVSFGNIFLPVVSLFAAAQMDETIFSSGSMYSSGEEEILANEGLRLSRSARWRERSSRLVNFEPAVFLFCFALSLSGEKGGNVVANMGQTGVNNSGIFQRLN